MDKMLQARLFSYPDTHRHRLGANFQQLAINCPFAAAVRNHQRDGPMCLFAAGSEANYFTGMPTTSGVQTVTPSAGESAVRVDGATGRYDQTPAHAADDYVQPGELYRKVMTEEDRAHLVDNIVDHLKAARVDVRERILLQFARVDKSLAERITRGLATADAASAAGAGAGAR